MAVTSHVYPNWVKQMGHKGVAMTADTFTAGLMTGDASAWGATQEAYVLVSDLTGAYTEIATVGTYTAGYAGRVAIVTLTFNIHADDSNVVVGQTVWTCTSPSPIAFGGGSASISARSMFFCDKTANSSSSDANSWTPVIIDFGATVSSTSGAYTYTPAAVASGGLAYFTSS